MQIANNLLTKFFRRVLEIPYALGVQYLFSRRTEENSGQFFSNLDFNLLPPVSLDARSMSQGDCELLSLPQEIFVQILSHLEMKEHYLKVCRSFGEAYLISLNIQKCFKAKTIEEMGFVNYAISIYSDFFENSSIELETLPLLSSKLFVALSDEFYCKITKIDLSKFCLHEYTMEVFFVFMKRSVSLKHLCLGMIEWVSDQSGSFEIPSLQHLETLYFLHYHCSRMITVVNLSALKNLFIYSIGEDKFFLVKDLPALENLSIKCINNVGGLILQGDFPRLKIFHIEMVMGSCLLGLPEPVKSLLKIDVDERKS